MADEKPSIPFARYFPRRAACAALELTDTVRAAGIAGMDPATRLPAIAFGEAVKDGDFLVKFAHNDGPVVMSRAEFLEKWAPAGDSSEDLAQRVGDLELALHRKALVEASDRVTLEQLAVLESRIDAIETRASRAAADLTGPASS